MPSALHEAIISLFRDRPELGPDLVRDSLGVALPMWSSVEVREAAFADFAPAEYRANLVRVMAKRALAKLSGRK